MPLWKLITVDVGASIVMIIDFFSGVCNLSPLVILGIGIIIAMVLIRKFMKIAIIIGIILILIGLATGRL